MKKARHTVQDKKGQVPLAKGIILKRGTMGSGPSLGTIKVGRKSEKEPLEQVLLRGRRNVQEHAVLSNAGGPFLCRGENLLERSISKGKDANKESQNSIAHSSHRANINYGPRVKSEAGGGEI